VPAVVVGGANAADVRFASQFLTLPRFGALHLIDEGVPAREAAQRASGLLDAPVEALARV
jgi:hypothetical protein